MGEKRPVGGRRAEKSQRGESDNENLLREQPLGGESDDNKRKRKTPLRANTAGESDDTEARVCEVQGTTLC